jgi:hypothetical protein
MLIRNMPLRRGGMHAKEVSRIWLTSDHCESRFMPDDNAPTQSAGQTLLASTRCSVADALIWLWPKTFGGVNRKYIGCVSSGRERSCSLCQAHAQCRLTSHRKA